MRSLIIFGCGFLGEVLLGLIRSTSAPYERVIVTVRSQERLATLGRQGVAAVRFDVNDLHDGWLEQFAPGDDTELVFMIPPSGIDSAEHTITAVVGECRTAGINNALLISSTGVYGKPDSLEISAETVPRPHDARSRRLAAIETAWRSGGDGYRILRLAGLYGPGRLIGRKAVEAGRSVGGDPQAWLNLIHVEDAASLTLRCLAVPGAPVELGADGSPTRRGEYYHYLANLLGIAEVAFGGESARNVVSKRCRPESTFARLDWRPRFPSFREGLSDALATNKR